MTPYTLRKTAEEFGILYPSAVQMRIRYLVAQYEQGIDWLCDGGWEGMPTFMPMECTDEIDRLKKSLKQRKTTTGITDEMIEQARNVNIRDLLEFVHGRTHCIGPDHEDKKASAYRGSRTGKLFCPVCAKSWGSIDIIMTTEDKSFIEAVKSLCA